MHGLTETQDMIVEPGLPENLAIFLPVSKPRGLLEPVDKFDKVTLLCGSLCENVQMIRHEAISMNVKTVMACHLC